MEENMTLTFRDELRIFIDFNVWLKDIPRFIISRRIKEPEHVLDYLCQEHPCFPKYAEKNLDILANKIKKYFNCESLTIEPKNAAEKLVYWKLKNKMKWNDIAKILGINHNTFKGIRAKFFTGFSMEQMKKIEKMTKGYIKVKEWEFLSKPKELNIENMTLDEYMEQMKKNDYVQ